MCMKSPETGGPDLEYKVKIDAFEGPLDLLLHLIKTLEINIYDIPVAEITDQYMDYIHQMQKLELDVASEYLVMAATLIDMKSRMLLPKPEVYHDDEDQPYEDPEESRQELMRQLLEYRRYKGAAETLRNSESKRNLLYSKPPDDFSRYEREDVTVIPQSERATLHDMLLAFQRMLLRRKMEGPLDTKIDRQTLPVGVQMNVVLTELKRAGAPLFFDTLFTQKDNLHLVVTFLAILELMKKNAVKARQKENFSRILVSLDKGADSIDTGETAFDY